MKRIKNGYISIEVVIIFTMIFMFGIFAVGRFVFGGQNVSDKESEAFKETYNTIYEGVGSGSIIPGPPGGGGGGGGVNPPNPGEDNTPTNANEIFAVYSDDDNSLRIYELPTIEL